MELLRDARYAVRSFAKSPGFTAIAVLTLALGIAGNASIFSTIKGTLFAMPPLEKPQQLARVWASNTGGGEDRVSPTLPDFLDWKQQAKSFSGMAAVRFASYRLSGQNALPSRIYAKLVSPGYLAMLRVAPALGRDFTDEDSQPGAGRVVILGHGTWQSQFGADRSVVGRTVLLNDLEYTVVGVLPANVWVMADNQGQELLLPLTLDPAQMKRGAHNIQVFVRLRDGVSKRQAQAEIDAIARRQEQLYPATNAGWGARIITLRDEMLYKAGMGTAMLMGPVLCVLLIACVNVANMLLARASVRREEMAVRAALGAGRSRLLRQLLTESGLLALCAGVVGLFLTWWGVRVITYFGTRSGLPIPKLGIDGPVLILALIATLASALLFGLAPALHATRLDLVSALKERESGTGASRPARRRRERLIVLEVALAVVFLVITAMLVRMIAKIQYAFSNPGFEMKNLVVFELDGQEGARSAARAAELNREVLESLRAMPGVQSAGASDGLPFLRQGGRRGSQPLFVPGAATGGAAVAFVSHVTPGLLETIRMPLLRGRTPAAQDALDTPLVAVISDSMAHRYWPGADPLGKTFKLGADKSNEPWLTVIGVVGDTEDLRGEKLPRVYLPASPSSGVTREIAVRAVHSASALIPMIKDAVRRVDKNQLLEDLQPAEVMVRQQAGDSSFVIGLIGSFAGLALLLSAGGIYGVMSYNVAERRREIGLRMALGAKPGQVLSHLLLRAVLFVLAGLAIGGLPPCGYVLLTAARFVKITGTDVVQVGSVFLLLLACGSLAAFIPAYRATRVDPMAALREE